ncbi:MAG: hypothetical protein K0R49_152 [Burkholderiales bacterium]|jgi:uncharacterized protein (TIGR01777 family)|nr:hypothetical protein [Burkholderiales bacterium]
MKNKQYGVSPQLVTDVTNQGAAKIILINGANSFIATNFMAGFSKKYNFIKLSHIPQDGHLTLDNLAVNEELLKSVFAVINLAGANIGSARWSIKRKNELLISRVNPTLQLTDLLNKVGAQAHFISASAVGIYPLKQENNEDTPINYQEFDNFSQQLTRQWESAARFYQGKLTIARFGVVLSGKGGAFPKILKPFLFYAGGPLGNGLQKFSWISLTDLIQALDYILDTSNTGIYNLVAPQIINNNQFTRHIAKMWHRPAIFKMPEKLINLLFGQMGQELFLNSLNVTPKKLLAENFNYQYPSIESCLRGIKSGKI